MKPAIFSWNLLLALFVAATLTGCKRHESAPGKSVQPSSNVSGSLPFKLNLKEFYTGGYHADRPQEWLYEEFHGEQIFDGVPFDVNGYCEAYGERSLQWHRNQNVRRDLTGILIGRKFDELHLIHEARFREYAGCTIATLRLNYDDGTHAELPIQYAVHVQDISRLLTEEVELLADPDSKIIWRGQKQTEYEVNHRLYKTRLQNPHPQKTVMTMDVINARTRASYVLAAATVVSADARREITPGLPLNVPARYYDGTLTVRVLDSATDKPLAGVDCDPGMQIGKSNVVGDPVLTDENGEAVFKYPTSRTTNAYVIISKPGYVQQYGSWEKDSIPATNVIRLQAAR